MAKARKRGGDADLVGAASAVIAERGWRGFSFAELARRSGKPLAEVYAELPDRGSLLRALGERADAGMLGLKAEDLEGLSPRERVFELVMRRLDALSPHKPALRVIAREGAGDFGLALAGIGNLGRLVDRVLDAAEGGDGVAAVVPRVAAGPVLAAIYVRVFNVWLADDTPDLARTLAELDRRLQQAEGVARWLRRGMGRARGGSPPTDDDDDATEPTAA